MLEILSDWEFLNSNKIRSDSKKNLKFFLILQDALKHLIVKRPNKTFGQNINARLDWSTILLSHMKTIRKFCILLAYFLFICFMLEYAIAYTFKKYI